MKKLIALILLIATCAFSYDLSTPGYAAPFPTTVIKTSSGGTPIDSSDAEGLIHDSLAAHGLQETLLPFHHVCTAGAGVLTTTACGSDSGSGADSLFVLQSIHDTAVAQGWNGNVRNLYTPGGIRVLGGASAAGANAGSIWWNGDIFHIEGRTSGGYASNIYEGAQHIFNVSGAEAARVNPSGHLLLMSSTDSAGFYSNEPNNLFRYYTGFGVGGTSPLVAGNIIEGNSNGNAALGLFGFGGAGLLRMGRFGGTYASPTATTNGQTGLNLASCVDTASGTGKIACTARVTTSMLGTASPTNRGADFVVQLTDSATTANYTAVRAANHHWNWLGATDDASYKFHINSSVKIDSNLVVTGTCTGCYPAGTVTSSTLTSGTIPIATGANAIGNSLITFGGNTFTFNSSSNINAPGGSIQAGVDVTAGEDVSAQRDITVGPSLNVHLYADGRITGGPLHVSSALVDSEVNAGGLVTGASFKDNSMSTVLVVGADMGGNYIPTPHTTGDTVATKQYVDGGMYNIPYDAGNLTTDIDTIPGFKTIGTYLFEVGGVSVDLNLPSTEVWPAGKPLTVVLTDISGGTETIHCTNGFPCKINDDQIASDTYVLPKDTLTTRVFGVTLVHSAGSVNWQVVSTATKGL